ncbi:MAG TPA: hypothetical protein VGS01_13710 [Candidatus Limnocylindria bacterium]|jgi:NADPH:quinone reductase-like Zn-dependent oxidoreductase|nr:hypothetical protein [Candidatus Limnocylindria bacterium]
MKAIIRDGHGSADVLHLREIDKPVVADDRILVRIRAASANAIDRHFVRGEVKTLVLSRLVSQRIVGFIARAEFPTPFATSAAVIRGQRSSSGVS